MATKNFVPRADDEGGIGTESKRWKKGYFSEGIFYDTTAGLRYNTETEKWQYNNNDGEGWIDIGTGTGGSVPGSSVPVVDTVEITATETTLDFSDVDIILVEGNAPGRTVTVVKITGTDAKNCILVGSSDTNYVVINSTNISSTLGGTFTLKRGDILELLWLDTLELFIERYSRTSA